MPLSLVRCLGILLWLAYLAYLPSSEKVYALLQLASSLLFHRYLSRHIGNVSSAALLFMASVTGKTFAKHLRLGSPDLWSKEVTLPILQISAINVGAIVISGSLRSSILRICAPGTLAKDDLSWQLVFPLIWLYSQALLSSFGLSSTSDDHLTTLPTWVRDAALDVFLDATIAEASSYLVQLFIFKDNTHEENGTTSSEGTQDSCKILSYLYCACKGLKLSTVVMILVASVSCLFHVLDSFNPDVLRIGCVGPADRTSTASVLQEIGTQLNSGANILLVPASSSYISDVPKFIQYKSDIEQKTRNEATVVVPTMNFAQERACNLRMRLQVYPMGEEKFLNSYTYDFMRRNNDTRRIGAHFGSLFLSWRSKRVERKKGSLSIASAICLDSEFPRIFGDYYSPDLLMVPNSAWSSAVHVDRLQGLKDFARRTSTAVLFCEDSRAGYIDPSGTAIVQKGHRSFLVKFNYKSRETYRTSICGLWWSILPVVFIFYHTVGAKHVPSTRTLLPTTVAVQEVKWAT